MNWKAPPHLVWCDHTLKPCTSCKVAWESMGTCHICVKSLSTRANPTAARYASSRAHHHFIAPISAMPGSWSSSTAAGKPLNACSMGDACGTETPILLFGNLRADAGMAWLVEELLEQLGSRMAHSAGAGQPALPQVHLLWPEGPASPPQHRSRA